MLPAPAALAAPVAPPLLTYAEELPNVDDRSCNHKTCKVRKNYLQTLKLNFTKLNPTKDAHNERSFINKIKEVDPDYNHIQCEALAIGEVAKLSKNETQKVAVISDSLSALQAITKFGVDKEQDYIIQSAREEIVKASQKGDIELIWIPSHTGITGNEHADKLALAGRNQNLVYQNNLVPGRSFLGLVKDKLWNQWIAHYKNRYQNKEHHYVDTRPTPSKIPWFYNIRYSNRAMISLIIRMRTNHCCTPTHLHKIGMKEDPSCLCGEYGSLDHIIFNCIGRPQLGNRCYSQALEAAKGPANMKSLCMNPTSKAITYIVKELIKSRIKIKGRFKQHTSE
nr:unnamed protein product [Callosobruchus analis]